MSGFEENEISLKSNGGTELLKRGLAQRLPAGLADDFQVICSRVRELDNEAIRVYWMHDLPNDPECNHLASDAGRSRFHKMVFCSNWQYQQAQTILGVPYDDNSTVIENAVEPFKHTPKSFDKIRLIYTSTPQRGLEILVPVFSELAKKYPNIHLDVFSSFEIYGWKERDEQYKPLYDIIRSHPQMTYHGFAPNATVREHLERAHILAYPSIWLETSCCALIEAMSAGLLCVHPNFGALPDTAGGTTFMYQGDRDFRVHAQRFYGALDQAIQVVNLEAVQNHIRFAKMYADQRFNWTKIAAQWTDLMKSLKVQWPSDGSRALPKQMFTYKV